MFLGFWISEFGDDARAAQITHNKLSSIRWKRQGEEVVQERQHWHGTNKQEPPPATQTSRPGMFSRLCATLSTRTRITEFVKKQKGSWFWRLLPLSSPRQNDPWPKRAFWPSFRNLYFFASIIFPKEVKNRFTHPFFPSSSLFFVSIKSIVATRYHKLCFAS